MSQFESQHSSEEAKLHTLRTLLLEKEQNQIQSLKDQIRALEKEMGKTDRFESTLVSMLDDAKDSPSNKARVVLDELIPKSIDSQIKKDPSSIIDSLYPVIGSIVSKYVSESIKEVYDTLNEKIENQLPYDQFVRTVKSKIQGISQEELLLREAQKVNVDAVFLIQQGSGKIIFNAVSEGFKKINPDMFAGLLMALESFGKDCVADESHNIDQIEYGDVRVLIESAGSVILATIVKGSTSRKLVKKVRFALSQMINENGGFLRDYQGEEQLVPDSLRDQIEALLIEHPEKKKKNKYWYIIPILFIGFLFILSVSFYHSKKVELASLIKNHPILSHYSIDTEYKLLGDHEIKGKVPNVKTKHALNVLYREYNSSISNLVEVDDSLNISVLQDKLNLMQKDLSGIKGHDLKMIISDKIEIKGIVRDNRTKKVINNLLKNYQLPTIVNVRIDFDYFYLFIPYSLGQLDLDLSNKSSLEAFISKDQSGKSSYSIQVYSSSHGSYSSRHKTVNERAQFLVSNLAQSGVSDDDMSLSYSLNSDGAKHNLRLKKQVEASKGSFAILERLP